MNNVTTVKFPNVAGPRTVATRGLADSFPQAISADLFPKPNSKPTHATPLAPVPAMVLENASEPFFLLERAASHLPKLLAIALPLEPPSFASKLEHLPIQTAITVLIYLLC